MDYPNSVFMIYFVRHFNEMINGKSKYLKSKNLLSKFMRAVVKFNHKTLEARLNKSTIVDELYIQFTEEVTLFQRIPFGQYKRLQLAIHPKQDIVLESVEIILDKNLDVNQHRIFCNGFQSDSESRLYNFDEKLDTPNAILSQSADFKGDSHIHFIPRKKGVLHSWTYGFIENKTSTSIDFIASLNEETGFTCLIYNIENQTLTIKKDIKNLQLTHSFPALDIVIIKDTTPSVFDTYFQLQNIKKPIDKAPFNVVKYQNWNEISEKSISEIIVNFNQIELEIDGFQIEIGSLNRVGDMISRPELNAIAQVTHKKELKIGVGFSPFLIEDNSEIVKNKSQWLLKNEKGAPLKIGFQPNWLGVLTQEMYVLDFYQKDVQEYLTGILHTLVDKWGYDFVQLDALYAACIVSRHNKTHGQIMHDVMTFFRHQIGNKIFIANDVPLSSAFGIADYSMVNNELSEKWTHSKFDFFKTRETPTVLNSLRSILGHWELNNRAFNIAVDSSIIKNDVKKWTAHQKRTVLIINALLGSFNAFDPDFNEKTVRKDSFGEGVLSTLKDIKNASSKKITHVINHGNDLFTINFELNGLLKQAFINLSIQPQIIATTTLQAFETVVSEYECYVN